MKSGENYSGRRGFLKALGAGFLIVHLTPLLQSCREKGAGLLVKLTGTTHVLGHRLWAKDFPQPSGIIEIPYLIIGGGISGLSAARQFVKRGIDDFLLIEMENQVGGNSSSGSNAYSKYPLGAHYLPLPNIEDKELISFLEESKIITHFQNGFPVFDETQLTFDPDERLFYKNSWQEGLVPKNLNASEKTEFDAFFAKMEQFRVGKGADGKYWFDIPLMQSSADAAVRKFDLISMSAWLSDNKFQSELVLQYIDYCCRDDFGFGSDGVSAWAGIHYFAARKFNASPDKKDGVLTWPEGNARLGSHLKEFSKGKQLRNHLAYTISETASGVSVLAFDAGKKQSVEIRAKKIVVATPQFVNSYLLENRKKMSAKFEYAPWLLATLTVSDLGDNSSFPLSWDNVIQGSSSLGYIYDQHQSLGQLQAKKVITWYYSFAGSDARKSRRKLYKMSDSELKKVVFDDLKLAHPDIETVTEEIQLHRIGHGMISPGPDFIWSEEKESAGKSIDNKIYFAHSDLSGISIFEEAFHQGINAVNQLLDETTLDS